MTRSLTKFLNKPETRENQETQDPTTSVSSTPDPEPMDVFEENSVTRISSHSSESESSNLEEIIDENLEESSANNYNILFDDPGLWPEKINNDLANNLVRQGPVQVRHNHSFPVNCDRRQFSENYYYRLLSNKGKTNRDWLLYSIAKDSIYFCCKIFGKPISSLSDLNGFSDWQHLSLTLKRHETSVTHNENVKLWVNLNNMLKTKITVNRMHLRLLESEKKHWYDVIERIIAIIKFLSRQCLAFRGTSKKLYEHNNGNFLKAIEMISSFAVMREHIRRIELLKSKNDSNRIDSLFGR